MTRKQNRYAGLQAAQKDEPYRLTPQEWADYFAYVPDQVFRKMHNALNRRNGTDWQRIKELCAAEMLRRQEAP